MASRLVNLARSAKMSPSKKSFNLHHPFSQFLNDDRNFSSKSSQKEVATYEDVKNLPETPETLLIDVREAQELNDTGVVPTSINIPLGEIKEKLSMDFSKNQFKNLYGREKPSVNSSLIFMCKIGVRSGKALEIAKQLGYKNGKNYLGSWEDWRAREKGLSK